MKVTLPYWLLILAFFLIGLANTKVLDWWRSRCHRRPFFHNPMFAEHVEPGPAQEPDPLHIPPVASCQSSSPTATG